jgi:hypothetical protein
VTDRAPLYPRLLDELAPTARHITEQYATDENVNGVADNSRSLAASSLPAVAA